MRTALRIFVVVGLVVMAGCAGIGINGGLEGITNESDDPNANSDAPDANPYGTETLTVAYDDSAVEMDKRHVVEDSLEYWENNSEQYAGYPISYELNQSDPDPDKHIEFVSDLERCGEAFDSFHIGCADYVTEQAPETAEIRVEAGYTNTTLRETTKHELGHTLGLDHNDEPQSIMASEQERSIDRDTSVQLRIADAYDERSVVRGIETALDTWVTHLESKGHDTTTTVDVVEEFDGDAAIAYNATDSRNACNGELVCQTDDTDDGDFKVTTEWIQEDDHESVMGSVYGGYHGLEADDAPPEYQHEPDS
ncbi:matrixin family metalloprotease [Halostagnicola sp. A-GB9-2]|uniref:matrixin family metalloprotease n=1 Tax=Halostagnicola sp. A-GB9-2 TaxID=3048066 RepID=UPI0024BF599A|nr:matrixin family metalloprotease [Halostagnicola sp. A-GB9-2]MDJ1432117.1 matrixin family metalloprotease [Halostagnicola sp. A-GB9-2]